eukprot:1376751-Amphidinium_carterae.1
MMGAEVNHPSNTTASWQLSAKIMHALHSVIWAWMALLGSPSLKIFVGGQRREFCVPIPILVYTDALGTYCCFFRSVWSLWSEVFSREGACFGSWCARIGATEEAIKSGEPAAIAKAHAAEVVNNIPSSPPHPTKIQKFMLL